MNSGNDAKNKLENGNSSKNSIRHKFSQILVRYLTFQEPGDREGFILYEPEGGTTKPDNKPDDSPANEKKSFQTSAIKRPQRVSRRSTDKKAAQDVQDNEGKNPEFSIDLRVDPDLRTNKKYIEKIYSLPKNKDIIIRDFLIQLNQPIPAFAVFIEGISDRNTLNEGVFKPLMLYKCTKEKINPWDLADYLKKNIVYGNQVDVNDKYQDIIAQVNYGATAVFIEGSPHCLLIETKGWDRRSIGKPTSEQVIRGPHEGFNETLRSNTGLIRKAIRNPHLITEMFKLGARNQTDVAIMYLENLANPSLVEEVKKRIQSINTDYVSESGMLEQFIEDHPFMLIPQVLATERPDRVVSFIMDGKVAVLLDGNPYVLIVPTDLFSLLHSPEDYYLRAPYGNIVRILRVVAAFIALITPAFYVSISTFHQEMIPTDLILAIAAGRATVPFPTIMEVFFMEFAFEMIREAGVRVPGIIGNTLGIVGALILGQAAVQAGIVSPILIIVVALTGLASFAIPNYSMSFAFRGIRFIFSALAAFFGFFGISAGLFMLLTSITSMKSFGVPMLSPIGPRTKTGPDVVLRGPVWQMEDRPDFLNTQDRKKQPDISRGWVKKMLPKKQKEGGSDS